VLTSFSTSTTPVYIDGSGHLIIQPGNLNGTWISGRMNTSGKQNFQYGLLEANIQAPDVTPLGLWPAFWTLSSDIAPPVARLQRIEHHGYLAQFQWRRRRNREQFHDTRGDISSGFAFSRQRKASRKG
jgi:hypothetical protein